ncbi:MAG: hypothetical protein ACTHMT_08485 [Verrucomicrobiota bacterium]
MGVSLHPNVPREQGPDFKEQGITDTTKFSREKVLPERIDKEEYN